MLPLQISQKVCAENDLRQNIALADKVNAPCDSCARRRRNIIKVPQLTDFPLALQGLCDEQVRVLRPFIISQGEPMQQKSGYRRRDKLTSLSWHATPTIARIDDLPPELCQAARAAYDCLMSLKGSPYSSWTEAHLTALRRLEGNDRAQLRLSFSVLKEPFLETALWPHLYPLRWMCESSQWAPAHWRPFEKVCRERRNTTHHSAKAEFMAKITSDIVDYARSFELLQFQFDRHIMRTILGSDTHDSDQDTGIGVDRANEHRHWCPNYWQRQHRYLQDLVKQLGPPQLFLTIAPWEFDFPWPEWVRAHHAISRCGPTQLPAAESLAVAHALQQFCSAYLAGFGSHRRWKHNLFANKTVDGTGQHNNIKAYVGRFEFQEGGAEHKYGKGRGSVHLHALFWFEDNRKACLEDLLGAEFFEHDPELATLARKVQRGIGDTPRRAEIHDGNSQWCWNAADRRWRLLLRHTHDYAKERLRPFLRAALRIFRCHSDVQWWDGQGALLRYTVGYVSKYNEAWDAAAMKDEHSSWSAALALLRGWRAAEPEMAMVLARQPMIFSKFTTKEYSPRLFGADPDETLVCYRQRPQALEHCTLEDWLRMHTVTGHLFDHSARATPRVGNALVCLGLRYKAWHGDRFFWQWLLMTTPHREAKALMPTDSRMVTSRRLLFSYALRARPGTWDNDDWVRLYFLRQGHQSNHV